MASYTFRAMLSGLRHKFTPQIFKRESVVEHLPRWEEGEDGQMKPVVSRIHVIPSEDRDLPLHCAQLTCWCSPRLDPEDECMILHQAMTPAKNGWFLVGEL
jgi:hypothetical protein